MTVTITETEITLDSDLFLANDLSQKATITHNCTTTYDVVTMTVSASSRQITAVTLGLEELPVGPFQISLAVTNVAATLQEETECSVYLGTLICDSLELYSDVTNIGRVLALEALKYGNDCMECGCAVMCELYNAAINETENATTDCGCG